MKRLIAVFLVVCLQGCFIEKDELVATLESRDPPAMREFQRDCLNKIGHYVSVSVEVPRRNDKPELVRMRCYRTPDKYTVDKP